MKSQGKDEGKTLQMNIEAQVNRLVQQLKDIEELTKEAGLSPEEIEYRML